jgi:hypothetical protein
LSAKLKEHVGVRTVLLCGGGSEPLLSSRQSKSEEYGRSSNEKLENTFDSFTWLCEFVITMMRSVVGDMHHCICRFGSPCGTVG